MDCSLWCKLSQSTHCQETLSTNLSAMRIRTKIMISASLLQEMRGKTLRMLFKTRSVLTKDCRGKCVKSTKALNYHQNNNFNHKNS